VAVSCIFPSFAVPKPVRVWPKIFAKWRESSGDNTKGHLTRDYNLLSALLLTKARICNYSIMDECMFTFSFHDHLPFPALCDCEWREVHGSFKFMSLARIPVYSYHISQPLQKSKQYSTWSRYAKYLSPACCTADWQAEQLGYSHRTQAPHRGR
jgi:hypothetical protein